MIASMPIVAVTLRGLLGRRRTFLMILLVALPVVIALLVRLADSRMDVDRILDAMLVRTVLPLVALVMGTAALGSELEDGTAVYLIIKPVPRWRIVGAKMLVAAGLTAALVVPSAVFTGLLAGGTGPAFGTTLGFAVAAAVGGSAGLLEGTRFLSIRQATLGIANGLSGPQAEFVAAGDRGPLDLGLSVVIVVVAIVAAFVLGSIRLARFEIRGAD
jgi:ABC-2 type transport system permease protein